MQTSADISIIIPARTSEVDLVESIESIFRQTEVSYEIIIVYNPKRPALNNKIYLDPRIKIYSSKKGVNFARNKGIEVSLSPLVMFLDSDCTLIKSDHLKRLIDEFNQNPKLTALGGPYTLAETKNIFSRAYNEIQNEWILTSLINNQCRATRLLGGNMSFRRSALEKMRFDENLIFGGTEAELFNRLNQSEVEVLFKNDLAILHRSNLSKRQFLKRAKYQARGAAFSLLKNGPAKALDISFYSPVKNKKLISQVILYKKVFSSEYKNRTRSSKSSLYVRFKKWWSIQIEIAVFTTLLYQERD